MKNNKFFLLLCTVLSIVACTNEPISDFEENETDNSQFNGAEKAHFTETGNVRKGFFEGMEVEYETLSDGTRIIEGDIIIPEDYNMLATDTNIILENGQSPNESKSVGRTRARWPNNTVYYTIASNLPNQSRVTNAIAHWENNTSLRFIPRTNQSNYIEFRSGGGCSSSVGMVGGRQYINLANGCSTGNTIHEIGHAIGLWHEQSRTDRDQYITVNFNNIQSNREFNFRTYAEQGRDGDEYTTSLDLGSIMMYGSFAFSRNGQPTITRKDGSTYSVQRNALSSADLQGINQMYPGDTGGGGEPTYENGQYYTVNGLRVYRYNDKWYYYSSRYGWREVVYVNGAWYYA